MREIKNHGDCKHVEENAPRHQCPYRYDVYNDPDPEYCNCCEACTTECAQDI